MKDLLIFDMDGVLVDVTDSYRAAIQATVRHFVGWEPSHEDIQDWKNLGGWNDDWRLSTRLIQEKGGHTSLTRKSSTISRSSFSGTITTA